MGLRVKAYRSVEASYLYLDARAALYVRHRTDPRLHENYCDIEVLPACVIAASRDHHPHRADTASCLFRTTRSAESESVDAGVVMSGLNHEGV